MLLIGNFVNVLPVFPGTLPMVTSNNSFLTIRFKISTQYGLLLVIHQCDSVSPGSIFTLRFKFGTFNNSNKAYGGLLLSVIISNDSSRAVLLFRGLISFT